jgi:lipoyl(octanoyl) transferase
MGSMCLVGLGPTRVMDVAANTPAGSGSAALGFSASDCVVNDWGVLSYEAAWNKQKELIEARAESRIPDTLVFVEHSPVITLGRKGLRAMESISQSVPASLGGVPVFSVERGGEATYHGPGQMVAYPIFKLDLLRTGPRHFLRMMEESVQSMLASFDLDTYFQEGKTGIWCKDRRSGRERKLASLGIAVSRSVSYHGLALNVTNDLKPFHLIQPCGYAPEVMTSLGEQMEIVPSQEDLKKSFALELVARFHAKKGGHK